MRQAFGLLVACLTLLTAGCAGGGGSVFSGNDTSTTPDSILLTPGTGNGTPALVALQPGASLLISAQALKSGLNMTLPGTGAFTWDASYPPAGTTYQRLQAGAVTTGSCPAPGAAATTIPASFSLATSTGLVTSGNSIGFATYTGQQVGSIYVVPLVAGSLPSGLPTGMTTAPPQSGYCVIVNAHYLGKTGSTVVFVGNSP